MAKYPRSLALLTEHRHSPHPLINAKTDAPGYPGIACLQINNAERNLLPSYRWRIIVLKNYVEN